VVQTADESLRLGDQKLVIHPPIPRIEPTTERVIRWYVYIGGTVRLAEILLTPLIEFVDGHSLAAANEQGATVAVWLLPAHGSCRWASFISCRTRLIWS
jgi:hypothetical protein